MSDIESHPEIRLKSRRPVWLEGLQQEEVSTRQKWSEEWATSDVTNHSPVVDPSIALPWIRPTSTLVVNVEPLSDWPGSMCSQPRPLESDFRSVLFLWRVSTEYVTYCERLSRIWNSPAVCQPCIWLRRRLSPGSACRAHAKKKKQRVLRVNVNVFGYWPIHVN